MKKFFALAVVAAGLCVSSCTSYVPVTATSNPVGSKCGTAQNTVYLGFIGTKGAAIDQACKNGGIKKISHVDYKVKSILGIITKYAVQVYGE